MAKRELGRPYWMPAAVALTSTASEKQFGTTGEAKTNVDILGGATNLSVSTFKLRDLSGREIASDEFLPILSLFGKRDSARPYFFWPRGIAVGLGNRLEVEVKNDAAAPEAAGHVIYAGIPQEAPQIYVEGLESLGVPSAFSIDPLFTGSANDNTTRESPEQANDFIVHGAFTNMASAQVRLVGVHGEPFMNDWTPVWGIAGRSAAQINTLLWPRPYFIPQGSTLTIDFKNPGAESSASRLWLIGQEIPKGVLR